MIELRGEASVKKPNEINRLKRMGDEVERTTEEFKKLYSVKEYKFQIQW